MVTQDIVITFNGKIYNVEKLRRELLAKECRFKGCYDTEGIIKFLIRLIIQNYVEVL